MFLSVGIRDQKKQKNFTILLPIFRWPSKAKSTQNNEELSSLLVQQKKSSHIKCTGSEKLQGVRYSLNIISCEDYCRRRT